VAGHLDQLLTAQLVVPTIFVFLVRVCVQMCEQMCVGLLIELGEGERDRLCAGGEEDGEEDRGDQLDIARQERVLWEEVALEGSQRIVDIAKGLVFEERVFAGNLFEA
jgi:hypothetical protein